MQCIEVGSYVDPSKKDQALCSGWSKNGGMKCGAGKAFCGQLLQVLYIMLWSLHFITSSLQRGTILYSNEWSTVLKKEKCSELNVYVPLKFIYFKPYPKVMALGDGDFGR